MGATLVPAGGVGSAGPGTSCPSHAARAGHQRHVVAQRCAEVPTNRARPRAHPAPVQVRQHGRSRRVLNGTLHRRFCQGNFNELEAPLTSEIFLSNARLVPPVNGLLVGGRAALRARPAAAFAAADRIDGTRVGEPSPPLAQHCAHLPTLLLVIYPAWAGALHPQRHCHSRGVPRYSRENLS